jgi:hypothetical protein
MKKNILKRLTMDELLRIDLRHVKLRNVKINGIPTYTVKKTDIIRDLFRQIRHINLIRQATNLVIKEGVIDNRMNNYIRELNLTVMNFGSSKNSISEIYNLCNFLEYRLSMELITNRNRKYIMRNY